MTALDARGVPFPRTACACAADVANCRRQPGYLGVGDAARIAEHLGTDVAGLAPLLRRGEAVLGSSTTGDRLHIATVVPARADGRCVFLDAADRCRVHAVSPFGCAYMDVHMSQAEADRRSLWMLWHLAGDATYDALARSLPPKSVDL